MSHHLDSPLARQDPRLDISDVYLFRGDAGTVFVMNVNPLSGPGGFHPEGLYELNVDTDGDAVQDLTFRVRFGPEAPDGRQPLELRLLSGPDAQDRDAPGRSLVTGWTEEPVDGVDGIRLWAGRAGDPFFIDASVVGAVVTAVAQGTPPDLDAAQAAGPANVFAGTNVNAIVLEVPDEALGAPSIGFWGTTALATDAGGWRQINRCAQPLVNTIFHPDDTQEASDYNTTPPSRDRDTYGGRVTERIAKVVAAIGSCRDPQAYGHHVSNVLFPDVLRYEVGTPATFGFAHRNGRGLIEPTPEVMFSLVLNRAVSLGLDATSATGGLREGFPYLASPVASTEAVAAGS